MNCLPCLRGKKSDGKKSDGKKEDKKEDEELPVAQPKEDPLSKQPSVKNEDSINKLEDGDLGSASAAVAAPSPPPAAAPAPDPVPPAASPVVVAAAITNEPPAGSSHSFTFGELSSATRNFNRECLLGESGFGKMYKGTLSDGKVVAVKQLDRLGIKPSKFKEEVSKLIDLHHPNLVELIGYCADGDQRLLVYEYMPMGSLNDHLHGKKPLDWIARMKAAAGAAKAMEYLHEKVNPPVLCSNVKSTNLLLDGNLEPKVADYGLVNLESSSANNLQQRVVGTVGCAPEFEYSGELTLKSDVYSFGVILLELITGRKAFDTSRPADEQNLVAWARQYFRNQKRFPELADPMFKGVIPDKNLNQAVEVAVTCLQEESSARPLMSDIVGTLSLLTIAPPEGFKPSPVPAETTYAPTKKDSPLSSSSSSSSSSSDSDSEPDLEIEIEPFPEPKLEPEPEWEPELESEPEEPVSESEPEMEPESEPEPEPEPEPESEPDSDSDSESSSDSDSEPEPVLKPKQVIEPEAAPSHDDQPASDHNSDSSSGSIYEEDAYSEEEFSDEDKSTNKTILINSRSKARRKSTKKKVMFNTEGNDSIKPSMKRIDPNSSKKSFKKSKDNHSSSYSFNNSTKRHNSKSTRKSNSKGDKHSNVELTDESDTDFETQRFKSTISRFNSNSRSYSLYQDENAHGSSSEGEE